MEYKNNEKILLILDLDETLIYATETKLNREADFKMFHYYVYKRPFLDIFIQEVKEDFLLAIWSSASDDYVEEAVKHIIPKEIKLEFIWGRSRCTYRMDYLKMEEFGHYDFMTHYNYVKPLRKLKKQGYKLEKILIVDDTPYKSKDNYGNAIYPKEFLGAINDIELEMLAKYLKTFKDKKNVRKIEKRGWQRKFQ